MSFWKGSNITTREVGADGNLAVTYDDLQGAVSTAKLPAVSSPTWRTFDFNIGGGIAFNVLGFAVNNYVDFYMQTTHSTRLNTELEHHIHFTTPTDSVSDRFSFQLDVIAAGIGEDFAEPTGTPYTLEYTLDGTESGKHNYFDFPSIAAANTTISTVYICRLTRIAASVDEYAGEVYIIFNDSHVRQDTMGSLQEETKV